MKVFLAVLAAITVLGAAAAGLAVEVLVDDSPRPTSTVAAEAPKPEEPAEAKPAKPTAPSPALRVVSRWAKAMANHEWAVACSLEAPAYRGSNCAAVYEQNFTGLQYTNGGVDIVKGLHVKPGSGEVTGDTATFLVDGPNLEGVVVVTLAKQKNGRWLVSNTEGQQ